MNKTKKILLVIFSVVIVAMIAVIPAFAFYIENFSDFDFLIGNTSNPNIPLNSGQSYTNTSPSNPLYIKLISPVNFDDYSIIFTSDTPISTVNSDISVLESIDNNFDSEPYAYIVTFDNNLIALTGSWPNTNHLYIFDNAIISQPYQIGTFLTDSLKSGFSIAGDFGTAIKNTFDGVFLKVDPETGNHTGISNFGSVSLVIIGISIVTGVGILVFRRFFKRS